MFLREHDVTELMGKASFTDVIVLDILGRFPTPAEKVIIEAVLIGLIDHGLSQSAIAARLTISVAPESLQGAVCAGLQGVGSVLVGSLESCAYLLEELLAKAAANGGDLKGAALEIVKRHKAEKVFTTGFGHPHFRPEDPRTTRLFALVKELGLPGKYVEAANALSAAVDEVNGKHLTMNSSMGFAVALREIDFPLAIVRGLAVICRSAGLVGHIYEEQQNPIAWEVWKKTNEVVPYVPGSES
jgi:citrate synthase